MKERRGKEGAVVYMVSGIWLFALRDGFAPNP